jgi:hypothetical protein
LKHRSKSVSAVFHSSRSVTPSISGIARDLTRLEELLEAWKDVNAKIDKRHSEKGDSLV